ncbi:MAG: PAS domain S-box protein [Candidatus Aenigmarchaeota archaeon]|nr:PAS domain S-box protein [Candidatus Aenigmarchaeota archaeon]
MNIWTKIAAGFVAMALLVVVVGIVSISELNGIARPLGVDVPQKIKESFDNVIYTSELESLGEEVRFYDEILTQSARNYALTGDKKWEKRYRDAEPKLDKIIKSVLEKGDDVDKKFFRDIDKSNLELVELEYRSISLSGQKKNSEAIAVLDGSNYSANKAIYATGIQNFFNKRRSQVDNAFSDSVKTLDFASMERERTLGAATSVVVEVVIVALILSIPLSIALSYIISKPIVKLTRIIDDISKGKLDSEIDERIKNGDDEISDLARSFNRTIVSLKLAMRETTPQLKEEMNHLREGLGDTNQIMEMLNRCYIVSKTDTDGKINYANAVFCELSGYTKEELVGANHSIVSSGFHSQAFWEKFWNALESKKVWRGDIRNKAKDGTIYWVRSVISPALDNNGKVTGFVSVRYLINDLMEDIELDIKSGKETETIRRLRDGD